MDVYRILFKQAAASGRAKTKSIASLRASLDSERAVSRSLRRDYNAALDALESMCQAACLTDDAEAQAEALDHAERYGLDVLPFGERANERDELRADDARERARDMAMEAQR